MGLLDELKNQAASRLEQEQSSKEEKGRNMRAVHDALTLVQRYLLEFADSVNVLKPEVLRNFPLEATIGLEALRQGDYAVRERRKTVDGRDYFEEVALRFSLAGGRDLVFHKETPAAVERTKEYLWGYSLRFDCRELKSERGPVERAVFKVSSEIPAAAIFTGNSDTGRVKLVLQNIEKLGPVDFHYRCDEIDTALLEELGKLVLGQPNNLRNLGQHQIMMMTTPPRPSPRREIVYPTAPESEKEPGLLQNLKSLIKRG